MVSGIEYCFRVKFLLYPPPSRNKQSAADSYATRFILSLPLSPQKGDENKSDAVLPATVVARMTTTGGCR